MSNLYDHAHSLEKSLRETSQFKEFKDSFHEIMKVDESKKLYIDFRDMQLSLSEKQAQGMEVTEEEMEEGRKLFEALQANDLIADFMLKEQAIDQVVQELSSIVTKPLQDVYDDMMN